MLPILLFGLVHALRAQPSTGLTSPPSIIWDRQAELERLTKSMAGETDAELISKATDPSAPHYARVAAAILLLRGRTSPKSVDAALEAFNVEIPPGIDESETAGIVLLYYPVAGEVVRHPEMMPTIIERTVNGTLSESITACALLDYQTNGQTPKAYLEGVMKRDLTPEQREICEQLMATLTGRHLARTNQKAQAVTQGQSVPAAKPSAPPKASTASRSSALPRLIGGVAIVLAAGLCWFLRRKARG